MTLMHIFCVALGGAAGALMRQTLSSRFDSNRFDFPFGTLAANMIACFALGFADHPAASSQLFALLWGTGFCASLSTFSSLAWQLSQMMRKKRRGAAALCFSVSVAGGFALFAAASSIIR